MVCLTEVWFGGTCLPQKAAMPPRRPAAPPASQLSPAMCSLSTRWSRVSFKQYFPKEHWNIEQLFVAFLLRETQGYMKCCEACDQLSNSFFNNFCLLAACMAFKKAFPLSNTADVAYNADRLGFVLSGTAAQRTMNVCNLKCCFNIWCR